MPTKKAATTTAPKKMRLRSKPKKPKRKRLSNRIYIDDGDTLEEVRERIREEYREAVPANDIEVPPYGSRMRRRPGPGRR